MRIIIGLILFFGFCSLSMGAERFPYVASIAASEVDVRSGPGWDFYETSVLQRGDKIEVYYETDDWLAVRPPLGSFSWVSGHYVDVRVGNIGTVVVDGLAARIGSENAELCETVQVKLKKGEKLFVLDRKETPENAASPLWYKISPPRGEYRWIPRSALTSNVVQTTSKRRSTAIVPVNYEEETRTQQAEAILPPPPLRTNSKQAARQSTNATPSTTTAAAVAIKRTPPLEDVGRPGEIPPLAELLANADPSRKQQGSSTNFPAAGKKELDPFQKAFEELKQEARVALTRPTDDWVFETLLKQGHYLYEIAPTNEDLEKVYHLVETLQRTRAVRQEIGMKRQSRTGGTLPLPAQASVRQAYGSNLAAAPRTPSLVTTAAHQTESPTYDVVGKLGEFQPRPLGHPPYAVVDDKEEIICLITPAPGVDLESRIGKKVGINGVLGIYQKPNEPDKRHIAAQSVAEIAQ